MSKFDLVRILLSEQVRLDSTAKPKLLDIGCRTCDLKAAVGELVDYVGADLYQNSQGTVDHIIDLEQGLPFPDDEFDFVVALDVIEHVDGLDQAVHEIVRVCKSSALIMLPNLAHLVVRLKFLFSAEISQKYEMHYPSRRDRHRWFTTLQDAERYFDAFAKSESHHHTSIRYLDGVRKTRIAKVMKALRLPADTWTWATLHVLEKRAR